MADDTAPNKMLVGDQNANKKSFTEIYKSKDIISVGTNDVLTHAAIDKGLKAEKINLGAKGAAFKDKGKLGCSDHAPLCFKFTLPEANN
jgi:hypothetical protein